MKKCLLIIDAHAVVYRAYHALPHLTTKKGELVNAVYGFLLLFFKVMREMKPDYIVACFDLPGPTFRHKQFEQYKATRPKAPNELREQIPKIKQILKSFAVPIFEKQGFEADDLIGTLASRAAEVQSSKKEKIETIILSGDLDLLQLVNENTKVYALKRGIKDAILYDKQKILERYGLSPALLPDYKALVGDPSDNIPGISSIGPKTATKLLQKFGTLENLYEKLQIPNLKSQISTKFQIPNTLKEKLLENKEQAFLSKKLVVLKSDIDLDFDLAKFKFGEYDKEKVIEILKQYEFHSLIERLKELEAKNNPEKKLRKLF